MTIFTLTSTRIGIVTNRKEIYKIWLLTVFSGIFNLVGGYVRFQIEEKSRGSVFTLDISPTLRRRLHEPLSLSYRVKVKLLSTTSYLNVLQLWLWTSTIPYYEYYFLNPWYCQDPILKTIRWVHTETYSRNSSVKESFNSTLRPLSVV